MGLDMYLSAHKKVSEKERSLVAGYSAKSAYVSGYSFQPEEQQAEYRRLVSAFGVDEVVAPDSPGAYASSREVSFTVAYWRKANQVHTWFVENVQGGVDECQEAPVSREQLTKLKSICERVLESSPLVAGSVYTGRSYDDEGVHEHFQEGQVIAEPALAQELLPAQAGFFFGSTDYDQWYLEQVKDTIEQIERALRLPEKWEFVYQSSW